MGAPLSHGSPLLWLPKGAIEVSTLLVDVLFFLYDWCFLAVFFCGSARVFLVWGKVKP